MQVANLERAGAGSQRLLPRYAACTVALAMIASGVSQASSAAVVHDGDPLGEAGDDLHVVLDHQHRPPSSRARSGSARRARRRPRPRRRPSARRAGSRAGRPASSIASSSLRLSPCESEPGRRPPRAREPDPLERPSRPLERLADARGAAPDPQRAAERGLGGQPRRSRARSAAGRRSRPGRSGRGRAASGGTAASSVMSWPSSSTEPAVGRISPESRLKSDVLPAPFGPMMPRNSPSGNLERDIGDDGGAADVEPEVRAWRGSERARSSSRSLARNGVIGGAVLYGEAVPSTFGVAPTRSPRLRARPGTSAAASRDPAAGSRWRPFGARNFQPSSAAIILSTSSPPRPAARARSSARPRSRPA